MLPLCAGALVDLVVIQSSPLVLGLYIFNTIERDNAFA